VEESVFFPSFLSSGSDLPSSPSSETSVPVIHGMVVFKKFEGRVTTYSTIIESGGG
jgi:hypothetical protein